MPRCICKFMDGGEEWLLEWDNAVGAPRTFGMSRDAFLRWHERVYGEVATRCVLPIRLAQVEQTGTSAQDRTLDDLIAFNRAGKGGGVLSYAEIVEWYCRKKREPEVTGKRWPPDPRPERGGAA